MAKEDNKKENKEQVKSKIAEREEEILKFWQENKIFEKSLEKESPKGNFVFYDGPPFATGLPHHGHILAGTIKDVMHRYKTMQGHFVRRVWGWDCHGLPVENLVEKELGLETKKDIEKYGIEKFNKAARDSVLRYEEEWKKVVPRVGRWVDMDHAYKTMDANYTESVWWSFKNLFDKNLVYEGFKVMPFCPHCGTTLSNFEVNLGYKDISDISVYVKFELEDEPGIFLLAWTTTPWTLPGNTALAVNLDIEYVVAQKENQKFILAKELAEKVLKEDFEIISEKKGKDLVGKKYKPVFDCYSQDESLKNKENGWKVYAADFVNTEDGTGIVHIAPAFGAEDYELSEKENLPFVQHVDTEGKMKAEIKDFAGLKVKPKSADEKERIATDIEIIKYLQEHGTYFDKKKITHSYPHCWRCDTPLLNYATSSWFVKVTDLKEKLVKLNKEIKWVPEEIGENRFGKWLEGARDWAVSRSRYWGAPLPVWRNEEGKVFVTGSIAELKERTKKSSNKYFVMRHGEAENNTEEIHHHANYASWTLTEKGKEQVLNSVKNVKEKIDIVISSPFVRTKETTEIVCGHFGFSPDTVLYDSRVQEWKTSPKFDGKPKSEFSDYYNRDYIHDLNLTLPEGESFADIVKRVGEFIYELESKYQNKNIFIVSHSGTMRALEFVMNGLTLSEVSKKAEPFKLVDNAEIRELNFSPLPHNENYELDLHRPYIDQVELIDEKGNKLTRIKEVFDTWYDSGSMPYAQVHYPFENKEEFEKKDSPFFPADFIAEGLDQTRGWFYTLLVLGVGVFGKSPYKNVLISGIVLAEDGQKMSKKLKNYPDPMTVVEKYGADSLRYYLLSSSVVRSEDLAFSEKGLDEVSKKVLLKLENVLNFFLMYKNELQTGSSESKNLLDRWIVSRLNQTGAEIVNSLEKYELDRAARPILNFIEDLSVWYIRRSRDRFKSDDREDKNNALATTHFVLLELAKYVAPSMPFFGEYVYQKLKADIDPESVHLSSWPEAGKVDMEILENMEEVRKIVSLALEKRMAANIKVRQPLQKLRAKSLKLNEKDKEYVELIKDEVNVKEIVFDGGLDDVELDTEITEELKKEGGVRELIRAIQELRKNMNLTPSQTATLSVETDEAGKEFVNSSEDQIKKPTNVKEIKFEKNDGEEVQIGNSNLKIKLDVS